MRALKSPVFLLMAMTGIIFGINLYFTGMRQNRVSLDFADYAPFIEAMKHGIITKPHFFYPLLVAATSLIFPALGYSAIGAGIVFVFQLLLAYILWKFWERILPTRAHPWLPVALSLAVMLVAPITALMGFDHHSYFGYMAITIYHNPPLLLCRPIALIHFLIFAGAVASGTTSNRKTALCFLTLTLATLMKPNYALIVVPVALLFAGFALREKDSRMLKFIVIGTILPGAIVLAWQYFFTYLSSHAGMVSPGKTGGSSIIFSPLFIYSDRSHTLFLKFILSTLFPLSVLLLFRRQALSDRFYLVALLLFIVGAAQSYFLAEAGPRLYDGNFLWSAELGLFLWFIVSMRLVLQRLFSASTSARWSPALIVVTILFSLHLVSGFLWYFHETIAPGAFW